MELDKRNKIQMLFTLLSNSYFVGFFKGPLKKLCLPGLNCYSCPGALGSCPIGSMQAVLGGLKYDVSYYVLGLISLFGILLGRLICGFLCPFGLFQDLLYKIPSKKLNINKKVDQFLRLIKYFILLFFVILMPIFLVNDYGTALPYFCKYICPSGTLIGGLPLISTNSGLRSIIGSLFFFKISILIIISISSIFIYRPFCKYICPLGAFYSFFNKVSFYKYKVNDKCINCNICSNVCKMNINPSINPNSLECIRCSECVKSCPKNAIEKGFYLK